MMMTARTKKAGIMAHRRHERTGTRDVVTSTQHTARGRQGGDRPPEPKARTGCVRPKPLWDSLFFVPENPCPDS